jgi:hypothetical protein
LGNLNQDETSLNTDRDQRRVDVYHHFDKNIEKLVSELITFLKNPIEIKIVTGAGVPVKMILEPQTPVTNPNQ